MLVEADAELYCRDHQTPSIAKHISLDISKTATDAQVNGELMLMALKKIEEYMGSSPRDDDFIELTNIHQTLMD